MAKFRKASADEAQAKRAEQTKSAGGGLAVVKGFKAPPSWNKESRSARFIMTSESEDRYRDIVGQAGLDIERFLENPQGLLFHNSRTWPCGNWSDITKILSGRPKRTEGTLNFLPEGTDDDADRAARHVAAGSLRTVSIGFIPDWDEVDFILDDDEDWTGGFRFNKSELIECSLVPIPANPDALVKDAGGDNILARNLVEEVLDTWAKTPEGLLIPMDEYRAKHMDLTGNRHSFVVDKSLLPKAKAFVSVKETKLTAATQAEAEKYVGAKVAFDPAHAENKGWPFEDVLSKATGQVIDSWIVEEGQKKGVHGLAVEFLTDDYSGMFRGIAADRFVLVKDADEPADGDDEDEEEKSEMDEDEKAGTDTEKSFDEKKADFIAAIKAGDKLVLKEAPFGMTLKRGDESIMDFFMPLKDCFATANEFWSVIEAKDLEAKEETEKVVATINTDDAALRAFVQDAASKQVSEIVAKSHDSILSKIMKFFGAGDAEVKKDSVEPVLQTPKPVTAEQSAEARAKAAAIRERLASKGLLDK